MKSFRTYFFQPLSNFIFIKNEFNRGRSYVQVRTESFTEKTKFIASETNC